MQQARTAPESEPARPGLPDRTDVLKRLEKVLPFSVPPKNAAAATAGTGAPAGPAPAGSAPAAADPPSVGLSEGPRRDWGDALDLVRQAADSVKAKEAHLHEVEASTQQLIERAYEEVTAAKARVTQAETRVTQAELKTKAAETKAEGAEDRARQAEARATAAETRAQEAEGWLSRIHSAVVEGFAPKAG